MIKSKKPLQIVIVNVSITNRIVSFESKSARTLVEQRITRRCPSFAIRTANYLLLQQPEHQQHQHQQQLQQQHQQHAKQQQKPDDIGDHSGVLDDRYEPVSFCSNITATQNKTKNQKSENKTTKKYVWNIKMKGYRPKLLAFLFVVRSRSLSQPLYKLYTSIYLYITLCIIVYISRFL